MACRVDITASAEAELEALYLWVVTRAPHQGAMWFNGLEQAILDLEQHPERCPVAPESLDRDHPVRVLLFGRRPRVYRVFFTVDRAHRRQLMICLRNDGYEVSLERRQISAALPDPDAARHAQVRTIDESGEDHLLPAKFFAPIELPQAIGRAVLAVVQL